MTPVKALKSGAALIMRTPADDTAWVIKYQAATERLKTKEVTAKAGASAQEVTGVGDAVREPGPVEAALGSARLDVPGVGGPESGSTTRTLVTVEAGKAETSVRDAGRADVEKSREVVEAPPDVGKEAEQLELQPEREEPRPQPQQDQPEEQAAEAQHAGGGANRREASPAPRVDSGCDRSHRR
jgi:hypothetical protein